AIDPDLEEDDGTETPHALCAEIEQHVRALLRDVICGYLDADLRALADDILIAGDEPIEIEAHDTRDEPEEDPPPEPGLFARTEPEAYEELEAYDDPEPESEWVPDHPAVNEQTRLPDGPGTAADPRSAAWAVASLPGPRTFREAPPPRLEDRIDVDTYYEEATIADERLPVEEPVAAEPEPVLAEPEPVVEDPPPQDVEAGVIHSADWDYDDDPASYSAPI
ncbi:MAG TPA: hypothetical protein VJT75_02055, partial [Thermoleophilaceae bacterium]|nr:hypothetical protein [Thermoleophilaceae bacterium]